MTLPVTDDALAKLVALAFDALCEKRVSDLVDTSELLAVLDDPAVPERVARVQARFVAPQRSRLIAAAKGGKTKLGAWLPDGARDEIAAELGKPAKLPPEMVDELVASDRVRDEVRSMLQDTLTTFVSRSFGGEAPSGSLRGAIGGAIGRGALGFAAAGKSLLGGLGDQVQKQLQERVRDFVDGSVAALQTRIADKLKSEDTAVQLGKRRREAFLRGLERTEASVAELVERAESQKLDRLVPDIVRHNLGRAELRAVIKAEADAIVAELSTQTIGELLDELGLRARLREAAVKRGGPLLRAFATSDAFAGWLTGLSSA